MDLIFFRVTNQPMFSKQEQWLQIDWANIYQQVYFICRLSEVNAQSLLWLNDRKHKTFPENWDSKAPSIGTFLAYVETTA